VAAVETALTLTLQSEYRRNGCRSCQRMRRRSTSRASADCRELHAVPFVTMCNLANLNAAMRGGLLEVIEVHLKCVGGGPTLDHADATAFLAAFQPVIDMALTRRLN
jgi:hypothetical protein